VAAPPPPGPAANPGKYIFDRPTDVGWDPAGNIFVSDGYGNSRVVKYDKNGRFIASVGSKGSEPGQFNLPHTLAVDAKGNVYVGDRSNRRIQVFDDDLTFKTIYDNVGAPWEVCVSPGPHQYLFSSNSFPDANDSTLATVTGEIYKMELDGTIVGKFGKAGKQLGEFSGLHEIDCRNPERVLHFGNPIVARAENHSAPEREIRLPCGNACTFRLRCCLGSLLFAQVPEIPFDSAATLLKLPANLHLGEAAGVATNSKGNIFVYTRTGEDATMGGSRFFTHGGSRLFEFDSTGKYLRESAPGFMDSCSRSRFASIRAGQHLDRGPRGQRGRKVRSCRPFSDDARPQAGVDQSGRRRRAR
jgi:hypothetical protein